MHGSFASIQSDHYLGRLASGDGTVVAVWAWIRFWGEFHYATAAILIITFVKIRFVFLDFMELRTAPWPLRMAFEVWAVSVCITLIGLYWLGV